jgi:hypothetical protein
MAKLREFLDNEQKNVFKSLFKKTSLKGSKVRFVLSEKFPTNFVGTVKSVGSNRLVWIKPERDARGHFLPADRRSEVCVHRKLVEVI